MITLVLVSRHSTEKRSKCFNAKFTKVCWPCACATLLCLYKEMEQLMKKLPRILREKAQINFKLPLVTSSS